MISILSRGAAICHRIVIIGGGFSAATFAVQLLRRSSVGLHIFIVEPREHLGRGLAYSAVDPDHRLNGPLDVQAIDPEHPEDLLRWCNEARVRENDPEASVPSGHLFLRRSVIGEYLSAQLALHSYDDVLGSTIVHVRDTAINVTVAEKEYIVSTSQNGNLTADMVILATGNSIPSLRKPFESHHASHSRIIPNPLEAGSLSAISSEANVLIVGSGLTALDMLSTLLRRGHQGKITVVSRRGLRPRGHSPEILGLKTSQKPADPIMKKMSAPIPDFIAREPVSVRRWCRALRIEIARVEDAGGTWHEPFDEVRDVAWKLWPLLPLAEKKRFLHRLRLFYDIHRFRTPPMNEKMAAEAEQDGRVKYLAANVAQVTAEPGSASVQVDFEIAGNTEARHRISFDYVVNCTGLDSGTSSSTNPLLAKLERNGLIRRHETGLGYDVTASCEAINSEGGVQPRLRIIGPPTAGAFGDPLGAIYISAQVNRILPDVMQTLTSHAAIMASHV